MSGRRRSRATEAAQEVRAKDYPLAFLRRRRDLLLRRETDPHLVLAGQPPRLAEEVDVVHMDEGAVPVPAVLHGGEKLARKSAAAEKARPRGGKAAGRSEDWWDGAAARRCRKGKQEEEDGGEEKSMRAFAASPPPPNYSLMRRSRGGEAWGGTRD